VPLLLRLSTSLLTIGAGRLESVGSCFIESVTALRLALQIVDDGSCVCTFVTGCRPVLYHPLSSFSSHLLYHPQSALQYINKFATSCPISIQVIGLDRHETLFGVFIAARVRGGNKRGSRGEATTYIDHIVKSIGTPRIATASSYTTCSPARSTH
jgi:hypothetical protein